MLKEGMPGAFFGGNERPGVISRGPNSRQAVVGVQGGKKSPPLGNNTTGN